MQAILAKDKGHMNHIGEGGKEKGPLSSRFPFI